VREPEATTASWPSVCAIVPTRDRPTLLARAVTAVLDQDYPGDIECLVVFDQSDIEAPAAGNRPGRTVRCIQNGRSPGLAGARNSGILAAQADLIAFCDDDDEWLAGKLRAQVDLMRSTNSALVATGIRVHFRGRDRVRLPPPRPLSHDDFLKDRHMEVNPCTVLVDRLVLLGSIGLVDETIPGGYGEDYEWLLRATRFTDIRSVPAPLVRVNWHASSFFADRWQTIVSALQDLLDRNPDFVRQPRGLARIEGQIAFAQAGLGDTRAARSWARRALSHRWTEPRAYVALLCCTGLVTNETVVRLAHRAGRGI